MGAVHLRPTRLVCRGEAVITNTTTVHIVLDAVEAKAALRSRIRAERRRRPAAQREHDARALANVVIELPEVAASGCVSLYASVGEEPGTTLLRRRLTEAGIRVLLPIVLPDRRLDWAVDDGNLRPVRGIGGPEPRGPRLGEHGIREASTLLVPALAVDTLGHRLGQGAGYYDRALGLVDETVPVIALLHEDEILDAAVEPVPVEPHDRPVDAVATARRCLRLR